MRWQVNNMSVLAFIIFIAYGFVETMRYAFHNIPHPEWVEVFIPYVLLLIISLCSMWQ